MTIPLVRREVDTNNGGELGSNRDFFQARNYAMNSGFDIAQRGTTFLLGAGTANTIDRWFAASNGVATTVSQQTFTVGQTAVPDNPKYFLRFANTSTGSGTSARIEQHIERVHTLANKTVTVSFWAQSSVSSQVGGVFLTQNFGTGGSPSSSVISATQSFNYPTSWAFFSFTFVLPSISGATLGSNNNDYLGVTIQMPFVTISNTDISQVMVNEGSIAGPWRPMGNNIGQELLLCQRYYELVATIAYQGYVQVGLNVFQNVTIQPKRASPTIAIGTFTNVSNISGGVGFSSPSQDFAHYVVSGAADNGAANYVRGTASNVSFDAEI